MIVATGCARAGVDVKNKISPILREIDMELTDFGTTGEESVVYPDFAEKVSQQFGGGRRKWRPHKIKTIKAGVTCQ